MYGLMKKIFIGLLTGLYYILKGKKNDKNITYKTQNFYISLVFLLITIILMIAASIYCSLIKHTHTHTHLLPFHGKKLN